MISRLRVYYFYVSIPVFVLIAGVAFYFNAIEYTVVTNPVPQILYAIFLVIFIGITSIMVSMRGLARETVTIKKFFRAAGSQTDKDTLLKLSGDGHSSYLLRMIALSAGRAISSHEFSSLQDELKKVGSRLTGGNVLPQFISGLLVGMGLVGTFIGLLSAVRDISGIIGELAGNEQVAVSALVAFSNLIQHLKAPMQSMGIAFSASLYGLLGSIITGLMMLGLRRFQSDIFSYLSSEVAQHSENSFASISAAPSRYSETVSDLVLARRNDEDTQILTRIEERLAEMARSQKRLLSSEAEALQKQRADMMQILAAQTDAGHKVREEIQGLGERLEGIINVSEKGSREISAHITELLVHLTSVFDGGDTQILTRIEERMAEMARSEKRLLSIEAEALHRQRADMMSILAAQTEASIKVRGEIQGLNERLEGIMNVSEKGNQEISAQLTELLVRLSAESEDVQILTRIEERMAEIARAEKRLLIVEVDTLQKQRADMMNILSAQTEASHKVRGEIQGLGERLESIINLSEKGSLEVSAQITELLVRLTAESNGEEMQILTRIDERMAEMARSQKRLLSVEAEALQKQQSDLIQILTFQTEAGKSVRGEIQGLGERLEGIINVSEKGNHEISSQITELIVHLSAESRETNRLLQYMIEEQHMTNKLLNGKDQLENDAQRVVN